MGKYGFIAIICLIVILFTVSALTIPGQKPIGRVNFLLGDFGDIRLLHRGSNDWLNVRLYTPVQSGDRIRTESESRCEVKINDGSLVRIGENTSFDFSEVSFQPEKRSFLSRLLHGKIWVNAKSRTEKFHVMGPSAVCAVRGTIYRMEADSTTRIAVYQGTVDVGPASLSEERPPEEQLPRSLKPYQIPGPYEIPPPYQVTLDQWIQIVQGFQIEVRSDGKYAKSRINEQVDAESDWVQWNKQRDSVIKKD